MYSKDPKSSGSRYAPLIDVKSKGGRKPRGRYAPLVDVTEGHGGRSSGDVIIDVDGLVEAKGSEGLGPYKDWPNDIGFNVVHEERVPLELKVKGKIPAYAAGTLYRTGPGGREVITAKGTIYKVNHWFDGFSQVHRFQILESDSVDPQATVRVLYNSRHGVDGMIEEIRRTGKLTGFSFGQKRDPCESYFWKVMTMFRGKPTDLDPADRRNTGVTLSINLPGLPSRRNIDEKDGLRHGSGIRSLWNKTDSAMLKEIDPETLEPIGLALQQRLHPKLKGAFSAAHARSDPVTGDFFNYNLQLGKNALYRIFRVSGATGKTDIIATCTGAAASYLHSLFLTENFVILCVWGSHYANYGLRVLWERNILDAIADLDPKDPKKRTKWFVVDRHYGRGVIATFEGDSFFCFHTVNAFEEKREEDGKVDILLDLTTYENMDVIKRFYYENIISTSPGARTYCTGEKGDSSRGNLQRWRLPGVPLDGVLGTAPCDRPKSKVPEPLPQALLEWEVSKDKTMELPAINPRFVTKAHRYIYGIADRGYSTWVDGLLKYDTETGKALYWQEHGNNPGEAIFIPDPHGSREDDGCLLSVVLDGHSGKSYLLVLNARDMQEMGRADMEFPMAYGFHGTHYPANGRGPSLHL